MDRVCVACEQPITDGEEWFRVHDEYVHRACSERYLKLISGRKRPEPEAPTKAPRK
jgi:hypothetical protein